MNQGLLDCLICFFGIFKHTHISPFIWSKISTKEMLFNLSSSYSQQKSMLTLKDILKSIMDNEQSPIYTLIYSKILCIKDCCIV